MNKLQEIKVDYVFIIPAFNPGNKLLEVVSGLLELSGKKIFVIDDGSCKETKYIFDKLATNKNVVVLKHAVNMGKGAALKTVFNFLLVSYPELKGVVTLDSDGQHSPSDCCRVLEYLQRTKSSNCMILGYRQFGRGIPLRSLVGNKVSNVVYRIVLGKQIYDTQTGLRGITAKFMKHCLSIAANRFEFETEQIVTAINVHANIEQISIRTLYFNDNKSTTFHPLYDSFKIYFVLLRFSFSSLLTSLFDLVFFLIFIKIGLGIMSSNILSRTVTTFLQFILLNQYVFKVKYKGEVVKYFLMFYLYVLTSGVISSALQIALHASMGFNKTVCKIVIESLMFFANFSFLRSFILTRSTITWW